MLLYLDKAHQNLSFLLIQCITHLLVLHNLEPEKLSQEIDIVLFLSILILLDSIEDIYFYILDLSLFVK